MAHDVYLIGLWDDYMSFYMVDKAEWDRIGQARGHRLGDMEWTPLDYKTIPDITDEEFASFTLDEILNLVKEGKINVLGTAEGFQL